MLITFSGIDSSGKTTQINNVVDYYSNNGNKIKVIWSRGGYTPLFNSLKYVLRRIMPNSIPKPGESNHRDKTLNKKWVRLIWLEIALFDMIILYCCYFRLLKMFGYTIIADRYLWDTYIDFKLKFEKEDFETFLLWKILLYLSPTPDLSFILTIPVEQSLRRSNLKNEPFSENLIQRKKRFDMYQNLIDENKWDFIIDGMKPIDEVWTDIRTHLV